MITLFTIPPNTIDTFYFSRITIIRKMSTTTLSTCNIVWGGTFPCIMSEVLAVITTFYMVLIAGAYSAFSQTGSKISWFQ